MAEVAKRIKGYADLDRSSICYWKLNTGTWALYLPGVGVGGLQKHEVTEHPDGTISVSPSIVMSGRGDGAGTPVTRHGFLNRGIWQECNS